MAVNYETKINSQKKLIISKTDRIAKLEKLIENSKNAITKMKSEISVHKKNVEKLENEKFFSLLSEKQITIDEIEEAINLGIFSKEDTPEKADKTETGNGETETTETGTSSTTEVDINEIDSG